MLTFYNLTLILSSFLEIYRVTSLFNLFHVRRFEKIEAYISIVRK